MHGGDLYFGEVLWDGTGKEMMKNFSTFMLYSLHNSKSKDLSSKIVKTFVG